MISLKYKKICTVVNPDSDQAKSLSMNIAKEYSDHSWQIIENFDYPIMPAGDSILMQRIKQKGYICKIFKEVFVIENRPTNTKLGEVNGYMYKGKVYHYLGYSFLYAVCYSLFSSLRYPFYLGLIFLYSYLKNFLTSQPRTSESDVLEYKKSALNRKLNRYMKSIFLFKNENIN